MIDSAISKREMANQYNVNPTPIHEHTGADSPQVSFLNIKDRFIVVNHCLFGASPATTANYSVFFNVPMSMRLVYLQESHTVAGSDGGAVTLNYEKLQSTEAPTAGVYLLATPFNLKGTANTIQTAPTTTYKFVLTNTNPPILNFAVGDRMGMILTGTPTAVANLVTTAVFELF